MMRISRYFLHFLIIIVAVGCVTKSRDNLTNLSAEVNLPQEQGVKEYEFQVGDVFDINFFENPELNQTVIVRPDGRISLPLVEELLVVGMTPSALDEIITERYREKITEPEITIILREFAGQKVYIGGEVFKPGVLQLSGRITLLQSIFRAGGHKRSAKLDSVILIRKNNNTAQLYRVDLDKILEGEENDFVLRSYDVVFIPKTSITKAGDFVDQYINNLTPDILRFGFGFVYDLNP